MYSLLNMRWPIDKFDRWFNLDLNEDGWGMNIDVRETDDGLEIIANVPGCKTDDIEVEFVNGNLKVTARQQESEQSFLYRERYSGSLSRVIPLGNYYDPQSIIASLQNGVLSVKVKRISNPQKIEIKIES